MQSARVRSAPSSLASRHARVPNGVVSAIKIHDRIQQLKREKTLFRMSQSIVIQHE